MKWNELKFWQSGEWQVIEEKLDDLELSEVQINPARDLIFHAMDETPLDTVKVAIIGQDPYPNPKHSVGLAFSIRHIITEKNYPPTLRNIFREYKDDLHYPQPSTGNLTDWAQRGVFLWNRYPVCKSGSPGSCHWCEWDTLNNEIITELDKQKAVFCFLGSVAHELGKNVKNNPVMNVSHPSPLGVRKGKLPFFGSRIFTTINAHLGDLGVEPVDWQLG